MGERTVAAWSCLRVDRLKSAGRVTAAVIVAFILSMPFLTSSAPQGSDASSPPVSPASGKALHALDSVGGYFTENVGQVNGLVRYYSTGNPAAAFRDDGVMFVVREAGDGMGKEARRESADRFAVDETTTVKSFAYMLRFEGANAVTPTAKEPLPFNSNFFIGNDPSRWRTSVPNYREVVYQDLYDGVDLVYRSSANGLKYDFIISPRTNPDVIRIGYEGVESMQLDGEGMTLHTVIGDIRDSSPTAYQDDEEVSCRFTVGEPFSYGFRCESWDTARRLIIDPLVYSTYLGGQDVQIAYSVAVDASGNAYVTGRSDSQDFPITPGAYDATHNGGSDVFVTKLNEAGTAPVYSTFLGSSVADYGSSIAVDSLGNAYVTGMTHWNDFPVTPGAYDTTYNNWEEAFLTKLSPDGSSLVYSTFLGGGGWDEGTSIAVDSAGSAYVTGITDSDDFPVTPDALDPTRNGDDAFVAKLNPAGTNLVYSTYLGGSGGEWAAGIAIDSAGHAYVAGTTTSVNFPVTPGAFDATLGGSSDAFVAKIDPDGKSLNLSTYIGGNDIETGYAIAVSLAGNAYVVGRTHSPDFPVTSSAFDRDLSGNSDCYVAKLEANGSALAYSTYLGGTDSENAYSVEVDSAGNAYVVGATFSTDYPVTANAFNISLAGSLDAFVTKLDNAGRQLLYSTFLGGTYGDEADSVVADVEGNAYVAGQTWSADFPVTPGALDTSCGLGEDAFVTKLFIPNNPPNVLNLGVQGFTSAPGIIHVTNQRPALNWTYSDPEGDEQFVYEVRVGSSSGGTDKLSPSQRWGTETTVPYSGSGLDRGVDYWFGVRVNDKTNWSSWEEVMFRLNSLPSPPPSVISPLDSSTLKPNATQTVSWAASTDADGDTVSYEWRVATDNAFTALVASGTTTGTTSSTFAAISGNDYYWRVRARDDYEPANWSAYGNEPTGYWKFRALSNTPPTILLGTPPASLDDRVPYTISWTMSDAETPHSQLAVYLNYSYGGNTYTIVQHLVGLDSYEWTLPSGDKTGVRINATVVDEEGMRGWSETTYFSIYHVTPPTNDGDIFSVMWGSVCLILIALFVILSIVIGWWWFKFRVRTAARIVREEMEPLFRQQQQRDMGQPPEQGRRPPRR